MGEGRGWGGQLRGVMCVWRSRGGLRILTWSKGAKGWMRLRVGQVMGIISAVALSFIVHEPSGIMQFAREMSFDASLKM